LLDNSIYPTDAELRRGAEDYFRDHNREFMRRLSEKDWKAYYAKKLHGPVKIYLFFFLKIFEFI